jgi:uncharacterized damage-inducible protein DinB
LTNVSSDRNPILTEMFHHNLWANLTLIDFCATLPDEILETNLPGTFGTIRETLGHLAGTEEGYLAGLVGDIAPDSSSAEEVSPNLATLRERALHAGEALALATVREHAMKSGEGLIAFVEAVEGNPTARVAWFGQTYEMPASLFLVQAINHATEHRAQIKTALTQAGVPPPELDGWTWDREKSGQSR